MTDENPLSEEQARLLEEEQEQKTVEEIPSEDETETLRQELAQMRDKWMRAVAETDNIRKRSQRELEESSRYAITAFARDMVNVAENLIRACGTISAETRQSDELFKRLGEGVDLTRDELLNIFEKYAIKRIDPLGEPFDHNFHQAVVQVENNEMEPGTVVEVVQAGYTIHNRLLRPAMVAVSKRSEEHKQTESVDTMA